MIDEKLLSEITEKYFQEAIKVDLSRSIFGTESVAQTSITYEDVLKAIRIIYPEYQTYKFNYELFTMFQPVWKPSAFLCYTCVS